MTSTNNACNIATTRVLMLDSSDTKNLDTSMALKYYGSTAIAGFDLLQIEPFSVDGYEENISKYMTDILSAKNEARPAWKVI
jgi:hypothetical protein